LEISRWRLVITKAYRQVQVLPFLLPLHRYADSSVKGASVEPHTLYKFVQGTPINIYKCREQKMSYQVSAPTRNELTGEYEDTGVVEQRGLTRQQLTYTYGQEDNEPIDPDQYNNAIAPHYAEKAAQANLPIFREDASAESIVAFWKSDKPLTDAEISAIQAAYVATDNADIANLLTWKLTGDDSFLNEQQRLELGIDDEGSSDDVEGISDEEVQDASQVVDFIFDNADEPNQETAQAILNVETDGSDASTIIQHLSYQYYNGSLSLDEAYEQALSSGIDHNELAQAFNTIHQQLHNHTNG
jgi:hypothetical protein